MQAHDTDVSLDQNPVFGRAQVSDETVAGLLDIERRREDVRQYIALISLGSLALLVIFSFVLMFIVLFRTNSVQLSEVKDIIVVIIGPVTGIVGAVVGFYFGERRR
jgi:amino acid transporter